jgi:hypothetical protein
LSAGTVLVRTHNGGVEHHELFVGIARQDLEILAKTPLSHHRR